MLRRGLYGGFFCVVLPLLLWLWCRELSPFLNVPRIHMAGVGVALAAGGAALVLGSMWQLWREAGGLPMNAYPPARRALAGPFAWLNHPIYFGALLAWSGFAIATGMDAALWLGAPLLALGCTALVLGYERDDTLARLGPRATPPRLRIAAADPGIPDAWDRISAYALIELPWLLLYVAISRLEACDTHSTFAAFEASWPVTPWTEVAYASLYLTAALAPLVIRRRDQLRRFECSAIVAMAIAFWCYLALPLVAEPKPVDADGWLGSLLAREAAWSQNGQAAFPSFHVYWALAVGCAFASRGGAWRIAAWMISAAVIASCLTTGMHSLADVIAGVGLFAVAWWHQAVWRALLRGAEAVANCWMEWRLGPMRILIHAVYAGVACATGVIIIGMLGGAAVRAPLLVVAFAGLICAGLWGQLVTGGHGLARPFGFFGHVIGTVFGVIVVALLWPSGWALAAAVATAAPVIQAIGRLRCLVQGCCHGRRVHQIPGIHYNDPRSRVAAIAGLKGIAVHPTPLYSIIANLMIFGLLLRLWSLQMDAAFIVGAYFLLAGLQRFVEEQYRGEPQTPICAGLRLYQWLAVAMFAGGGIVALLPSDRVSIARNTAPGIWLDAAALGLLYAFAMGVDWPESKRRLARLG